MYQRTDSRAELLSLAVAIQKFAQKQYKPSLSDTDNVHIVQKKILYYLRVMSLDPH